MNLTEYQQSTDRNVFWRLQSGEHQALLDEAIEEIGRLRAALAPFAAVAQGIPANWPADARLREDAEVRGIERRFHLAYWPATCGSGLPAIAEWREAAKAAESEER